ncbi:uncharacterized protein TrAFT101_007736 [Trichoderma asperellum]|uniref:uncharacterized protein n=1 Tax=Trichoderma asperellum TaxID=101201 RepID=UPI00331F4966|nr:hypothetical protein TrAFT101_007736 [Trichoderma asperellum]
MLAASHLPPEVAAVAGGVAGEPSAASESIRKPLLIAFLDLDGPPRHLHSLARPWGFPLSPLWFLGATVDVALPGTSWRNAAFGSRLEHREVKLLLAADVGECGIEGSHSYSYMHTINLTARRLWSYMQNMRLY